MIRWLFTCEHGGNRVPRSLQDEFRGAKAALESHRGWDAGALCVYRALTPVFADAAFCSRVSRLVVDLNRSSWHRGLFSEFTVGLPAEQREQILANYYRPWRRRVADQVDRWRRRGDTVLHISVHSFSPVWHGETRNADIGFLYDPQRPLERVFCREWRQEVARSAPHLHVRFNYPYRGKADGHTTWLRRRHPEGYAGIELELNEAIVGRDCADVAAALVDSLRPMVERLAEMTVD